MPNIENVRQFVINALRQYHTQQLTVETNVIADALSDYATYTQSNTYYVAQEAGKGLSTNDFTTTYMTKLDNLDISNFPTYAYWDNTNSNIVFMTASDGSVLSDMTISGANFIKDGMVDSVSIEDYDSTDAATLGTSYLYIDFNIDSGKSDIKIPLQDIFNPDNYYTKSEIDTTLSTTYLTKADAGTTYLSKEDAAAAYITYEYAGNTYVAKENGKGLSEANFTSTEKTKLSGIAEGAQVNVIESVSVDGTALTVTSKGVNIDLSGKVDKVDGKGLSTNDYTSTEKTKLSGIETGAQVNVIESVKVNGTAQTVTDKAVDITVPTNTSDLTNDSNFVSDTNYVHTDNNYTTDEKTKLSGIQAGAQVNNIESVKVNGTALTPDANKAVNIEVPNIPNITFSGSKSADGSDYTYVANGFSASGHEITVSYTGVLKSHQDISGKEDSSNKKTSLSVAANISDNYYPSTSAVSSYIGSLAELTSDELAGIFASASGD